LKSGVSLDELSATKGLLRVSYYESSFLSWIFCCWYSKFGRLRIVLDWDFEDIQPSPLSMLWIKLSYSKLDIIFI
jgi:hypothetical protein